LVNAWFFSGTIIFSVLRNRDRIEYEMPHYLTKIRVGDDILVHFGNKHIGEKGQNINFRATVKKHSEYKGIKSTIVNRPSNILLD